MAIYHLHAKALSRANGRNAVESAAYRHACALFEETLGEVFDYSRKTHVIHSELNFPRLSHEWLKTLSELSTSDPHAGAEALWNLVEQSEKRKDAQVAREIEFSLPIELNQEQCQVLAREFIAEQFVALGMIADWSIHWEEGNPHVHVMLTTRELTTEGFGYKVRDWNTKSVLNQWREKWAEYANFHLRLHHHDVRIDHRSYIDQGIHLVPTFHLGRGAIEIHQQGFQSDRVLEAKHIAKENLTRIHANPEVLLQKITAQTDTFTSAHIGQALSTYADSLLHQERMSYVDMATRVLTAQQEAKIFSLIENHESVFSERDIARALNTTPDLSADLFTQALLQIKVSPALIPLGAGEDGRDRYTTKRLFELENRLQTLADQLQARRHCKLSDRRFERALSAYQHRKDKTLTDEQRRAVRHLISPCALTSLVGRAGTGKSFSLGAAKDIWESQGYSVLGVALSGIAASGLEKDAGMPARTIESFRYALSQGQLALTERHVVVMDEAGMTDIESMACVMDVVTKARAKLVLVGDPSQLQPVGPGAVFRALLERIGFVEIQTVYRQTVPWQVEATRLFAQGDVEAALGLYQQHGNLVLEKTEEEAMCALTQDWLKEASSPEKIACLLVLAHRNVDVTQLNQCLRDARIERRDIQAGFSVETAQGRLQISVGDRLLFLKNDRRIGVSNGRFATVTNIQCTEQGTVAQLNVQLDGADSPITLNPAEYAHFTHGYAATVHKSQGVTVDHSFIFAGGKGWDRCLSYVAHTRHRLNCRLYASQDTFSEEESLFHTLGRAALKDSVLDFPLRFSQRRGFENPTGLKALPQRLIQTLKTVKENITQQYAQIVRPTDWAQKQQGKLHLAEKAQQDAMRREDARLVAAYVDAHRAVGETFAQETPDSLSPRCQTLLQQRNALAFEILKDTSRYARAIDICALNLKKLSRQAKRHQCDETIKNYLSCVITKPLSCHQLAATIYADIKAHYPSLKQCGIDTRELKIQALAYQQRNLLKSCSKEARADFRLVYTYYQLCSAVGKAWHVALSATSLTPQARVEGLAEVKMAIERDRLAHLIYQYPERFDKALDFFQIGIAAPRFEHECATPENMQKAQQRWFKLQQYAGAHTLRQRITDYIHATKNQDFSQQQHLAFDILQKNKAHHPFIIASGIPVKELWSAIRRDAALYTRKQLLKNVSAEQFESFFLVERYHKALSSHKNAWRELFESKEKNHVFDMNRHAALAKPYTEKRNQLAAQILDNLSACQPWFEHFKLKEEELHAAVAVFNARLDVERYARATTLWEKSSLALILTDNPKGYHSTVLALNLNWKEIYQDARPAKQKRIYTEFTSDEKSLHRCLLTYKKINRHAGQLMRQKDQPELKHTPIANALSHRLNGLFAKRDYLAAQLGEKISAMPPESLTKLMLITPISLAKCQQQDLRHQARIQTIHQWQSCFTDVLAQMRSIQEKLARHEKIELALLQSAMQTLMNAQQYQRTHRLCSTPNNWRYALHTSDTLLSQWKIQLNSVAAFKEQLQQVMRAQHITLAPIAQPIFEPSPQLSKKPHFQRMNVSKIRQDLKAHAQEVALWYLGEPKTRSAKTLSYGSNQGSLKVTLQGAKQGYWCDFQEIRKGEARGGDMLSLIHKSLPGASFKAVLEEATRFLGGHSCYIQSGFEPQVLPLIPPKVAIDEKAKKTQEHLMKIVNGTHDITGTLAERYLQVHRGISGTARLDTHTFRYHPKLKHWVNGQTYPALVVLARDKEHHVCGLQAIFLDPVTAKIALKGHSKLSRGTIGGGALIQAGDPNGKVAFAEGVETALSVANAHPDWQVHVTFGVSNFQKVPLQTNATSIVICADNDGPDSGTVKTVERAATHLSEHGIDVWVALPTKPAHADKWDFNDALKTVGVAQITQDLDAARLIQKGITVDHCTRSLGEILDPITPTVTSARKPQPVLPLSEILRTYLDMELEQEKLVCLKIEHMRDDPVLSQEYAKKSVANLNAIYLFTTQWCQHPEIQSHLASIQTTPGLKTLTTSQFSAIKSRFLNGKETLEDISLLAKRLHTKAQNATQKLHQQRSAKKGRTQI